MWDERLLVWRQWLKLHSSERTTLSAKELVCQQMLRRSELKYTVVDPMSGLI